MNSEHLPIPFGKHTRIDIINMLARRVDAASYLEIGCSNNECFNHIDISKKVGVDPKKGGTLRMTSDEYFSKYNDKFDIVFVDGLHHYEQIIKDIDNSLAVLNDNGFIIIHDLLPFREAAATKEISKTTSEWNGDVWRISFDLVSRNDITFRLVCSDFGCGIISKKINLSPRSHECDGSWSFYKNNWNKLPLITFEEI